jgi:hypothetical protein
MKLGFLWLKPVILVVQILDSPTFITLKSEHEVRVRNRIRPILELREASKKHPVLDFLFDYYSFRPALLERYSPGFSVLLSGDISEVPHHALYKTTAQGWTMDLRQFPVHRFDSLIWLIDFLEKTEKSEPVFSCLGLHEWAMVYKEEHQKRHQLPLRLSTEQTQALVESRPLRCTHYDAFRFFTQEARPLNHHQLTKQDRVRFEQPGCIHANMDVYRWAFKFYPWIDSELIWQAFDVAWQARWIDMKASPYDVSGLGETNILIETREGAEEYVREQKRLYSIAKPIRQNLINSLKALANHVSEEIHDCVVVNE